MYTLKAAEEKYIKTQRQPDLLKIKNEVIVGLAFLHS